MSRAMKSFTSLEQSKKLAEILPLESADMEWLNSDGLGEPLPFVGRPDDEEGLPCWSLAALLNALPKIVNLESLFVETSPSLWHIGYRNIYIARAVDNVDACVEIILKLHELNFL